MHNAYSRLAQLVEENKAVALATVVSGSPPLLGAKMLVPAEGERVGGIDPDLDGSIEEAVRSLLAAETNSVINYRLGNETVEIFVECFQPPQRLVIIGAVHVAIPLHRLAKVLGYHVTVVDARALLATAERFPVADRILIEWPDDALTQLGVDSATSVVVLTHDPKFDIPALKAALRLGARYIGAIGSRATNEARFATLKSEGVTDEQITRIYAPVGLDIGSATPAEIALAVLAEVIAVRMGRAGGHLRNKQKGE